MMVIALIFIFELQCAGPKVWWSSGAQRVTGSCSCHVQLLCFRSLQVSCRIQPLSLAMEPSWSTFLFQVSSTEAHALKLLLCGFCGGSSATKLFFISLSEASTQPSKTMVLALACQLAESKPLHSFINMKIIFLKCSIISHGWYELDALFGTLYIYFKQP